MSDPQYGEPVEEPTPVDDVVGRANEGLADAEAAKRDAVTEEELAASEPVDGADAAPAAVPDTASEPAPVADPTAPDYEPTDDDYAAAGYVPSEPASQTTVYPSGAAGVDPVAPTAAPAEAAVVAPAAVGAQPIFVQAPEAPLPRGNRAAAGAIGLLAAIAFAILYLGAWLGFGAITGEVTTENVGETALSALGTWALWVPVVTFFIAFWLLGAIINRGRWGHWVIFGLLVGIAAYGGHLLGQLFQAPFWDLTASQGATLVEGQLLAPLAIAALVFGRELTIWFGAWVAARGKRVTELNIEAQREYERTLEAGPQLYQQP